MQAVASIYYNFLQKEQTISLPKSWLIKKDLFDHWLKEWSLRGHESIKGYKPLIEMINYSLLSKSKCFRPVLFLTCLEALGQPLVHGKNTALAIECIHTYSLIHDDLPCMDDDDMRRGQLSAHKKYDEERAVLSGDALLTLAFELICQDKTSTSAEMALELAKAAGMNGMVAGQLMDIESTGVGGDLNTLESIHKNKTGALIAVSLKLAAIRANQNKAIQNRLYNFGIKLGLMFQIRDDILDVSGNESLGKSIGKDAVQGKLTYPSLLGLEKSNQYLKEIAKTAKKDLDDLGMSDTDLSAIIDYLVLRKK